MKGFSVTEAIVVCAIVGIVTTLALPSLAPMIENQRVVATVNSLVAAMQTARHASLVHRTVTVVCPADGNRCGQDWSLGWMVSSASSDWEVTDPVPDAAVHHVDIPAHGVRVIGNRRVFRFRPFSRSTNGTLIVCGPQPRRVIVSVTGRVRSDRIETDEC